MLNEVRSSGSTVKIFHGEKVVAEIIPADSAVYRANMSPHENPPTGTENLREEGYSYKTMGETLKSLN